MELSPFAVYGTHLFTLLDRTGQGGAEIIADGQRIVFPRGEPHKVVSRTLVEWLFSVEQQKVWTTEGDFVQRFGVTDPSPDLVAQLGPEVADISPIEIDRGRIEGSDTSGFDRERVRIQNINVPSSALREKQGAGTRVGS